MKQNEKKKPMREIRESESILKDIRGLEGIDQGKLP